MKPSAQTEGTYTPSSIIGGEFPRVTHDVTLIDGQNLKAGAVLGKITASGKYTLALSASADGSQTPDAILAEDCDASGGDATAVVYETGEFRADKLTFGAGVTAASAAAGLRGKSIFLR